MVWVVTGGCGFVGSNLARELLDRGEQVMVIDNLYRHGSRENLAWLRTQASGSALRFVEADVADREALDAVFASSPEPVRGVAHLAGQVAMTRSLEDPVRDFLTNAAGTLAVLEAVRRHAPEAVVLYASTNKVYGDLEWVRLEERETRYVTPDFPSGFPETVPLDFSSPYGCSKGAADQYVLDYARSYGLRTAVFRHSTMYGGRQFATYDQGWIGWFAASVLEQADAERRGGPVQTFTISGDGKQVRDILEVGDAVALYIRVLEHPEAAIGQAFNIGGGLENSLSILEYLRRLGDRLGVAPRFEPIGWRAADQRVFVADNAKIGSRCGWRPTVSWQEGTDRMLEWVRGLERRGGG